jgi:hypothetical protein
MKRQELASTLMPWAGLVAAILATALVHQVGSETAFDDCTDASPLFVALLSLGGLALIAAGGFASLRVWQRRSEEAGSRAFIAAMSLLSLPIFLFAVLMPVIAALLLPRCYG